MTEKGPIGKEIILPNGDKPPLSEAYRAGNLLFISGQLPFEDNGRLSNGDIERQTQLCLESIERILALEGMLRTDLVKLTIWLKQVEDFPGFNNAYREFFGEHRPARSTVRSDLMLPEALVEIEAIAVY